MVGLVDIEWEGKYVLYCIVYDKFGYVINVVCDFVEDFEDQWSFFFLLISLLLFVWLLGFVLVLVCFVYVGNIVGERLEFGLFFS